MALFAAMTIIMAVSVASRFLMPGVRIARFDQLLPDLFVWLAILGTAAAARRRSHLGMLAIVDRLPPMLRAATAALAGLCGVLFFAFLAWKGYDIVQFQMERGSRSPSGYPAWVIGAAIPVGSVVAIIRVSAASVREVRAALRSRVDE